MNTLYKHGAKYNVNFCLLCGLSTDVKPSVSINGVFITDMSIFIEIDTGLKYIYDILTHQWNCSSVSVPLYTYDDEVLKTYDGEIITTLR